MSRAIVLACLPALCNASCGGQPPQSASASLTTAGGDRIEWQGMAACADCDGIQADLVLEQAEGKRRYTLTEDYITGSDSQRFVERGRWQRSAGLLRLRGDSASLRVYAMLPDGRLQACDGHGDPLPNAADGALVPVAFSGD